MGQCSLPKKYSKIFLISSKLIATQPPAFSNDTLSHPCLQLLELHKSRKQEGGAVRGVTACSHGNELQLPMWGEESPTGPTDPHSTPSLPFRPTPSPHPHCLCPSQFFSPIYPALFSLPWFDPLWAWVSPQHKFTRAFLTRHFRISPSNPILIFTTWKRENQVKKKVGNESERLEKSECLNSNICNATSLFK